MSYADISSSSLDFIPVGTTEALPVRRRSQEAVAPANEDPRSYDFAAVVEQAFYVGVSAGFAAMAYGLYALVHF